MIQNDVAAERAVLSGICQYGSDLFLDITDLVTPNTFSIDSNKIIYKCVEYICKKDDNIKCIDLPTILSAAQEISLSDFFDKNEESRHLNSVLSFKVDRTNVRRFASKLRKLEIGRLIYSQAGLLQEKISEIDGTEPITQLLGIAENTIYDFTSLFDGESELQPKLLGDDILEYVKYLEENPCDILGVPTGFPAFDESIGGGLNPGVAMIGARPKVGKTTLSINIARNIASSGIPVLYLDTEMIEKGRYRDISNKLLACTANVDINDVKTGRFADNELNKTRVVEAAEKIKNIPLYRLDIAGKPFEDQLFAMRRWVQSEVGFNLDGTAKDCVIIYDYLKLMSAADIGSNTAEYQLLGMMMTGLQNFGTRYGVPILSFTQLNRDGIDRENTDVVSGSDRITWFCTSFSIFKDKNEEEIGEDGPEMGNKKVVTILSRYGPGHDFGEYVHIAMNKYRARISEVHEGDNDIAGFEVDRENDDQITF